METVECMLVDPVECVLVDPVECVLGDPLECVLVDPVECVLLVINCLRILFTEPPESSFQLLLQIG